MYTYNAQLVKVTDGDTVIVNVDLGFRISREIKLRLDNINAPEVRAKGLEGEEARDALISFLKSGKLVVQTEKDPEVWDRYTAVFYKDAAVTVNISGTDISKWMVDNGHAVAYDYPWD